MKNNLNSDGCQGHALALELLGLNDEDLAVLLIARDIRV